MTRRPVPGGPVLLLDGRSGTGKTTLAARIARLVGGSVVHLDDLYPGWGGLRAGSDYATAHVLEPLAAGRTPAWRRWDWHAGRRAETHRSTVGAPLVLEGCGALSRANRALADLAVWLELDERARRARALARDGDDSWWDGWRAEEDAFIRREDPRSLADLVVDRAEPDDDRVAEAVAERLLAARRDRHARWAVPRRILG